MAGGRGDVRVMILEREGVLNGIVLSGNAIFFFFLSGVERGSSPLTLISNSNFDF